MTTTIIELLNPLLDKNLILCSAEACKHQSNFKEAFTALRSSDDQITVAIQASEMLRRTLFGPWVASFCFEVICNFYMRPEEQEKVCEEIKDKINDRKNVLHGLAKERLKRLEQQRWAIIKNPSIWKKALGLLKGISI